jgi:hypothetical protein
MLSARLIRIIETHYRQITDRFLYEIERQPDLSHLRQLPAVEVRERTRVILEHLGDWLAGDAGELEEKQEEAGKLRYHQAVPLHEAVLATCLMKETVIQFIEEQGIRQDTLGVYAEEELERRLGRFFDRLIVHLVRGYEGAWRRAILAAA